MQKNVSRINTKQAEVSMSSAGQGVRRDLAVVAPLKRLLAQAILP